MIMKTRNNKPIAAIIFSLGIVLSHPTLVTAEDYHDTVQTKHGKIVRNSFDNCVRTDWMGNGDECGNRTQLSRNAQLPDEDRTIYFEFNKTRIQETERYKLDSLSKTLRSMRDISGVRIIGYADRIGSAHDNEALSRKRAMIVEKALQDRGYLNTTIAETRWFGEEDSVTQCDTNLKRAALVNCLHNDRRVTVEITY